MKYIKKTIVDEQTGIETEAHYALELLANLTTGRACIKEGNWKDGQAIADGKGDVGQPILWEEPDISALVLVSAYPEGASLFDTVFDTLISRMLSMPKMPDGVTDNPLYGGTVEEVPPAS